MSRFTGYVAVVNHLGGKFTADSKEISPVLTEIAARGLGYLDDGASPRSVAPDVAAALAMPSARADLVIDADPTPEGDRSGAGAAPRSRPRARLGDRRRLRVADERRALGPVGEWARIEGRRSGPSLRPDVGFAKPIRAIQTVATRPMSRELPYRPCVGVALVNRGGEAFIGHRKRKRGAEVLDARSWQMPQGGIDAGEQPLAAAKRELWEETSVRSVELIAELPRWLKYDLPEGRARTLERALSRADPEMVPVPIYRPGQGNRRPPPRGRRARRRIRRLALGALRAAAGACGAVQARGLRESRSLVRAARAPRGAVSRLISRP